MAGRNYIRIKLDFMKHYFLFITILCLFASCTSTKNNNTISDATITETYWKLNELNGKAVMVPEGRKEAHLILKKENARLNGNNGCNIVNGSYELSNPNRIRFSQMISTKMACMDMDTESEFMNVLSMADSYHIKGDTLQLFRARMAPLAKFQAVYLK